MSRAKSLYRTPKEKRSGRPPMPPNVLQTSFMLERWLEDRKLPLTILSKRSGVSKLKTIMFIRDYQEHMRNGTLNIRFDEVIRLQQAAVDIDHELFAFVYTSWL